jgi:hypothetical protein
MATPLQRFLSKLGSSGAWHSRRRCRTRLPAPPRHDRPAPTRGFLLDRARLVAMPIGLEAVTRTLLGRGLCGGGTGLEFARRVVVRLREVLRAEGRASRLETCLDGTGEGMGLTAWDATASPEAQLQAAGHLHAGGDTGTATVLLPPGTLAPEANALLRHGWARTEVIRLCIASGAGT